MHRLPIGKTIYRLIKSGLPDFSWYMLPKREKIVPNEHKNVQNSYKIFQMGPYNIPNGRKIYQYFPI
jgi:hypothetical protein